RGRLSFRGSGSRLACWATTKASRLGKAMAFRRAKFLESEAALLQRAAAWPHHLTFDSLTGDALRETTERQGVDFATALLFERLQNSSKHSPSMRRIDALRRSPP